MTDEIGGEIFLLKRRRAEAGLDAATQREARREVPPRRKLAIGGGAKIGIMFDPARRTDAERRELALEIEIAADIVAMLIDDIAAG